MRIKVKTKKAAKVLTVDDGITFKEFIEILDTDRELYNDNESTKYIKAGYPPKTLDFELDNQLKTMVRNGDQLILETEQKDLQHDETTGLQVNEEIPSVYIPELGQYLILRNIADDNSCMFNALVYAMKQHNVGQLRQLCSDTIEANPDKYTKAILGRTNEGYSQWILEKDSWGGAIELGILSDILDTTINCIDVESGNIITFKNENSLSTKFINLIYSGVHYDILSLNPNLSILDSDKANDVSVFDTNILKPINSASSKLCKLLQTKNYTTNLTTFRIRCLTCYKVFVGELGANEHANSTGHYNFGQLK